METKTRILKILQKNARLSPEQIAERLRLDVGEVAAAIQECEESKIIRGYYTLVSEERLGHRRVRALIEVSVAPERDTGFDRIARTISKFAAVTDVLLVSGNYDLLIIVEGNNLQEVAEFVAAKLSPVDGVRSTRTHFMLKKYKESGFSYQDDEDYERLKITP